MIYDGESNTRLAAIGLGTSIHYQDVNVAVDPGLNRGYATYSGNGNLSIIDATSLSKLTHVTMPEGSARTAAAHTGRGRAYVQGATAVQAVDGMTYALLGSIPRWGRVAVNSRMDRIYIARSSPRELYVVDGATHTVVETILLPHGDGYPAVNEATGHVYIAHRYNNAISVVQDMGATRLGVAADHPAESTVPASDRSESDAALPTAPVETAGDCTSF